MITATGQVHATDHSLCSLLITRSYARKSGYGTYTGRFYFGCLVYADVLESHSMCTSVMQYMLDISSTEAESLDFAFNTVTSIAP